MKSLRKLIMNKIIEQIRMRRKHFGLLQKDMEHLIGMKQSQYQKVEAGGNIKLRTLERILRILKLQMVLVPKEKIDIIQSFLEEEKEESKNEKSLSLLEKYQVLDDE